MNMWKKIDSPAGEGSPIVTRYNYATGQYMRPSQYGYGGIMANSNFGDLSMQPDNRQTRMGNRIVNAKSSKQPNYMIGNGNSPMDRGGANMFPSPIEGYQYLTTGGYPPAYSMPQNSNIYPAMFNHATGERIDPQSGGLIKPVFKDKHFSGDLELDEPMFGGVPEYLKPQQQSNLGGTGMKFRDVNGSGGYRYRQFEDGSIHILQSPRGGSNTVVQKGSNYHQAITAEIGTYPMTAQSGSTLQNVITTGQAYAQSDAGQSFFKAIFDSFIGKKEAQTAQYQLQAEQAKAQQQAIAESMQPSAWEKAKPYLLAVGIIGAIGTGVYYLSKPKKRASLKK